MSGNTQGGHGTAVASSVQGTKMLLIALFIVGAFLLSYSYAAAQSGGSGAGLAQAGLAPAGLAQAASGGGCAMSGSGSSSGGGGCCGGGGPAVEGSTTVEGDVQRIAVDTSSGSFNPNVIKAKAGVPIEIAFSQAPGGCLSGVLFPDFGINEDLTAAGKTISLPALDAGEYQFYCQMQMVSATIVVE